MSIELYVNYQNVPPLGWAIAAYIISIYIIHNIGVYITHNTYYVVQETQLIIDWKKILQHI